MTRFYSIVIFFFIISLASVFSQSQPQIFIRLSQVGFLPSDIKTAIILADTPIQADSFLIIDQSNNQIVFMNVVTEVSRSGSDSFNYKELRFDSFTTPGKYFINYSDVHSEVFEIGESIYNSVVDSLMLFLTIQRCGPTNPFLHKPCHLSDVSVVIGDSAVATIDVTGGWHDAGDYIKFFSTAAYTTYMLLFAYEFDEEKFNFDNNRNSVPDILEEARVGLDWLLRCNYAPGKIITQVQDLDDHQLIWRMPEEDSLKFDRPGFYGIGKNQIGIFTAVMASAYRIWLDKFLDSAFAFKCLNAAINLYSFKNSVANIDSSYSGFYQDNAYWGKLALGAVELFYATGEIEYLNDAKQFADSAGSDFWWSSSNINSLADYKLSKSDTSYLKYIENNLKSFKKFSDSSSFGLGMPYSWGTTNSFLGITLQGILFKAIAHSNVYDNLIYTHRDFVLGRNAWGLSFIYGVGRKFPQRMHSQVGFFRNGFLPGALTAGPAPQLVIDKYRINRKNLEYEKFNSENGKFYDDFQDFVTNEPTISGNATAIFVYGFFSNR